MLNDIIDRNSYSIGRHLTQEEIKQFRTPQIVLQRMYTDTPLGEEVRRIKIAASNNSAINLLIRDLFFKGTNAQFNKEHFLTYIQKMHLAKNDIFGALNRQARRKQRVPSTLDYIKVPNALCFATLLYQKKPHTIDYFKLASVLTGEIVDLEKVIPENWFENNQIPEYRQIGYMPMYIKDITRPQDVTEEATKAFYVQSKKRFTIPAKREIDLLRFGISTEADDAAAAELADGASFEMLLTTIKKKQSLILIRKGPITKAELLTLMAEDIFALPKGKVSAVINTLVGPIIMRVVSIYIMENSYA
ncbi:MAG: peptidyl-prolyl cis-trans isomerase D [Candidatus Tokpelaia sp. JSC188]|nr:MAG: peptidyl-prolyl cis-trans isomerase D [Candidatus Tokpelaia sp. JSC188]